MTFTQEEFEEAGELIDIARFIFDDDELDLVKVARWRRRRAIFIAKIIGRLSNPTHDGFLKGSQDV